MAGSRSRAGAVGPRASCLARKPRRIQRLLELYQNDSSVKLNKLLLIKKKSLNINKIHNSDSGLIFTKIYVYPRGRNDTKDKQKLVTLEDARKAPVILKAGK